MRRRLFTAFGALSLLLCGATIAVWVFGPDDWKWYKPLRLPIWVNYRPRTILIGVVTTSADGIDGFYHSRAGFVYAANSVMPTDNLPRGTPRFTDVRAIGAPPVFFVVLFALLPVRTFMTRYPSRVTDQSPLCAFCSYNLTGNTSGTCPECGAARGVAACAPDDSYNRKS